MVSISFILFIANLFLIYIRIYTFYRLCKVKNLCNNFSMSIRETAIKFIKLFATDYDREQLKKMVLNGVTVGSDFAIQNNITAEQLTNELKAIYKE